MASTDSTKKCVQCGAELFDDARFCVVCGTPVLNERPKLEPAPPVSAPKSARMRPRATNVGLGAVGAPAGAASEAFAQARGEASRAPAATKGNHDKAAKPAPSQPPAPPGSLPLTLEDIDSSFDAILDNPGAATASTEHDIREVESMFRQIARAYVGPVRELAIELTMGDASQSWLALCAPSVKSLHRAATDMGLGPLADALGNFSLALAAAEQDGARVIAGEHRTHLLASYKALEQAMPEAFAVEGEETAREGVILQSLLQQVPGLRKVALDKIYAAGLTSLAMFYAATPEELAQTTGIPLDLAERVTARFREHRQRTSEIPPDDGHAADRDAIRALTRSLSEQTDRLESLSKNWEPNAAQDKRRVRQEREETVLQLNVVLARLGEVELVKSLERAPFSRKVELVSSYLEAAEKKLSENSGDPKWPS
jgi:zinc-ribbon domain/Helix-hairpin-helix domain